MRTSYPVPSFSDGYQYKIVDSTFIHAVHIARSKGTNTYTLGISLLKDQDTIIWYIVKEPLALYHRLTDPKQSPGFIFNNSVKGKQNTKQAVVDKKVVPKPLSSYLNTDKPIAKAEKKVAPSSHVAHGPDIDGCCGKCQGNIIDAGGMSISQVYDMLEKIILNRKCDPVSNPCPVETYKGPTSFAVPKENKLPEPSKKEVEKVNPSFSYGPMLDAYGDCGKSSCISYLALGYNKAAKGLVVYYSLTKSSDVHAIETDDITLYRDWIESDSLGKFYNEFIRYVNPGKLLRSCAK
jgi:hypothetical protein